MTLAAFLTRPSRLPRHTRSGREGFRHLWNDHGDVVTADSPPLPQGLISHDPEPKHRVPLACHYQGRQRYLTATHGQLPGQVSATTTGGYVALQAGGLVISNETPQSLSSNEEPGLYDRELPR